MFYIYYMELNNNTMKVSATDLRIGDVMRFKNSKYEPAVWLTITDIRMGKFRADVAMGKCAMQVSIASKAAWATIKTR